MVRFLVVYSDTWQIKLPTDHVPSRELLWLTCDFLLLKKKKKKKPADSVGGGSHGEGCSRKKKLKAYTFHETTLQTVSGNKRVTFVEKKASLVILFPL